ncbi:MAG: hypothetical protein OIF34_00825, partial [Porticoccaceae bacterium]|nr:hypothetical protein [Porticoccaceae bacterium]
MNNRIVAWLALVLILPFGLVHGAEEAAAAMSQQQLNELIENYAESVKRSGNAVEFVFEEVDMLAVSDANADRMRI